MHLWHLRPGIPLFYAHGGDEILMLAWTKALVDDGWYLNISHLGAPFGMSFGDFPIPNMLHMLVLRVITLVIHNPATALNLYFLGGFPIIALVAAYVLRRLGLSWSTSIAVAVAYAFLPTRFMRNESHLFYAQYYLAPMLVLAVLWAARGHALYDPASKRPTRDGWIYLAGLFAVSWDNEYFAIFGMLFLSLAAIAGAVRLRHIRGAIVGFAGIVVLLVGFEAELLPYTIYQHQNGADAAAIVRPPQASEVYALTLAQLVLPIQAHRVPKLAAKRALFDSGLPMLVNENSSASLGALGALGLLGSLGALLVIRRIREDELWPDLARFNLAAFLLTTLGGVGALISYYFVPELRAYNRVSPIIGFISFVAIALALDYARRRWLAKPSLDRAWYASLTVILVLAILDQTSPQYVPAYAADSAAFLGERAYAAVLEQRLPPSAAIYQIPHVLFPEGPPVEQLGSWDEAGLYLHSKNLHYSFGATRGRSLDVWEQTTDQGATPIFVTNVILAGFDAIAVYRNGYADGGKAVDAALSEVSGEQPLVRDDGTTAVYDLSKIRARYLARIGNERAAAVARRVIAPTIAFAFGDGFYGVETAPGRQWNWAGQSAALTITNSLETEQHVRLGLTIASSTATPAHLVVRLPSGQTMRTTISSRARPLTISFTAPPGISHVQLESDGARVVMPGDARNLRFQALAWSIAESDVATASDIITSELSRSALHAMPHVSVELGPGCYGEERSPSRTWNWCTNAADLIVTNASRARATALLQYTLTTGAPAGVTVATSTGRSIVQGTPDGAAIEETLVVPPGRSVVHLSSQAAPIVAPGDARHMVFQIANLRIGAADAHRAQAK